MQYFSDNASETAFSTFELNMMAGGGCFSNHIEDIIFDFKYSGYIARAKRDVARRSLTLILRLKACYPSAKLFSSIPFVTADFLDYLKETTFNRPHLPKDYRKSIIIALRELMNIVVYDTQKRTDFIIPLIQSTVCVLDGSGNIDGSIQSKLMDAGGRTISIAPGASHDKVRINVTTSDDALTNQLSTMQLNDSLEINVTKVPASSAVEESVLGSGSRLTIDCFPDGMEAIEKFYGFENIADHIQDFSIMEGWGTVGAILQIKKETSVPISIQYP
jgi:hypothetical protein